MKFHVLATIPLIKPLDPGHFVGIQNRNVVFLLLVGKAPATDPNVSWITWANVFSVHAQRFSSYLKLLINMEQKQSTASH